MPFIIKEIRNPSPFGAMEKKKDLCFDALDHPT